MKSGATDLLKFKKVQRRLNLPKWQAVGLLETLWIETARNAPAGDIGRFTNDDIASMLDYHGDENELIQVLIDCRWLDTHDQHRLVVHDWSEHVPNWLRGNFAKHGKIFANQAAKHGAKQPKTCAENAANASDEVATKPNQVKSSQVKPNQTKPRARAGLLQITVETLKSTEALMDRFSREVARTRPLVTDSDADRLRVLGAAERALEDGDNPAALFVDIVKNAKWGLISQAQEDRASDRLKAYRASAGCSSIGASLASQLKINHDSGVSE